MLISHVEGCILLVPSQFWDFIQAANVFFASRNKFRATKISKKCRIVRSWVGFERYRSQGGEISQYNGYWNGVMIFLWGITTHMCVIKLRQDWFENVWISIKLSLKFVPGGPISNIPTLVQITAWRRRGHKALSESMMVSLRIYGSVGLNELNIRYFLPTITSDNLARSPSLPNSIPTYN